MPDITLQAVRLEILNDIKINENKERKAEALRRYEVFRGNQKKYVIDRLKGEFDPDTVKDMRTITSINLTKRIVHEQASIYRDEPSREISNVDDKVSKHIENLYELTKADVALKKANKYFKFQNQVALMVVPVAGELKIRVLQPHHYDVVPELLNPEKAKVYILNLLDKNEFLEDGGRDLNNTREDNQTADNVNQSIADRDDYKAKTQRFLWWSDEVNFVTNGRGEFIDDPFINPIGELPFIDIAIDKDFEFWIRDGASVVDFALDYLMILSDTANTNRMQSYAQGVFASEKPPTNIQVGPNKILWLKLNDNKSVQPTFEFIAPNADLKASLDFLDVLVKNFLTAEGLDPNTVGGTVTSQKFSSGLERLLAMIEKFEASRDDIALFKSVEMQLFRLIVKWNNVLQGTIGEGSLNDEFKGPKIPEDAGLNIQFAKPEVMQTKAEKIESNQKEMDAGLKSRVEAIMDIREVDKEKAEEIAKMIDDEDGLPEAITLPGDTVANEENKESKPQANFR